jgi:hypothetical protein
MLSKMQIYVTSLIVSPAHAMINIGLDKSFFFQEGFVVVFFYI